MRRWIAGEAAALRGYRLRGASRSANAPRDDLRGVSSSTVHIDSAMLVQCTNTSPSPDSSHALIPWYGQKRDPFPLLFCHYHLCFHRNMLVSKYHFLSTLPVIH